MPLPLPLLLLLLPALLTTQAFVPAVPRSLTSAKPAARLTIDGRRRPTTAAAAPGAAVLLARLHAHTDNGKDDDNPAAATTTNEPSATTSTTTTTLAAALTRRVRALLGQCVAVSLMLLAQFRPVALPSSSAGPGAAGLLRAPQGTWLHGVLVWIGGVAVSDIMSHNPHQSNQHIPFDRPTIHTLPQRPWPSWTRGRARRICGWARRAGSRWVLSIDWVGSLVVIGGWSVALWCSLLPTPTADMDGACVCPTAWLNPLISPCTNQSLLGPLTAS